MLFFRLNRAGESVHDLPPAFRPDVGHLFLSARQPARRRGADHRSGAGEGRPLSAAGEGARPAARQGGRHAYACRPHHRPGRAARQDPLHHCDGRADQGRRGVDAARRRRPAHHRGPRARRDLYARPHRRLLQLHHARPGVHRRHAAHSRHRPHRLPERRPARAIRIRSSAGCSSCRTRRWSIRRTTTRAIRSPPSARRRRTTRGFRSNRSTNMSR